VRRTFDVPERQAAEAQLTDLMGHVTRVPRKDRNLLQQAVRDWVGKLHEEAKRDAVPDRLFRHGILKETRERRSGESNSKPDAF
jgi:hypothetical protein